MMIIDVDDNGYPTDDSLDALYCSKETDREIMNAVADYFNGCGTGRAEYLSDGPGGFHLRLVTGGWSGCEDVLSHIPVAVWGRCWEKSERGGAYEFSSYHGA